jgi:eukaryotic-like serine/threonine-protein kinase
VQYGDMTVVFVSPSERNSDRFLESFSIAGTPSNNKSLNELANQSIASYRQKYADFQLIGSNAITLKSSPAYVLKYLYTDQLFGKAMAMDIGMTKAGKLYVLTYSAEPAKFYSYIPTIQRMIDSFQIEGLNSNESRNDLSNSELA